MSQGPSESMEAILARIDQKLTVVCGHDGTGGRIAEHDGQIRSIQLEMAENRPMNRWVERGIFGIVWGAAEWFLHGRH